MEADHVIGVGHDALADDRRARALGHERRPRRDVEEDRTGETDSEEHVGHHVHADHLRTLVRTVQTTGQNGAASGRSGRFSGCASVPATGSATYRGSTSFHRGERIERDTTMLETSVDVLQPLLTGRVGGGQDGLRPGHVLSSTQNIPPAQASSV
jgi:hypothetical protein